MQLVLFRADASRCGIGRVERRRGWVRRRRRRRSRERRRRRDAVRQRNLQAAVPAMDLSGRPGRRWRRRRGRRMGSRLCEDLPHPRRQRRRERRRGRQVFVSRVAPKEVELSRGSQQQAGGDDGEPHVREHSRVLPRVGRRSFFRALQKRRSARAFCPTPAQKNFAEPRDTGPRTTLSLKSLCGGGVPSSHPSLGLSDFSFFFSHDTGHGTPPIRRPQFTPSHDTGPYCLNSRSEENVIRNTSILGAWNTAYSMEYVEYGWNTAEYRPLGGHLEYVENVFRQ